MELAYLGAARTAATYLTRGEPDASVYVRGGLGTGDFAPGLSDVDLALVLDSRAGAERVQRRWLRLHGRLHAVDLIVDWPRIYDEAGLRRLAGASVLTYPGSGYSGEHASLDAIRMLERPGLYGATADWRLLRGADRRPPAPERDDQDRRIAAWLELLYWWRLIVRLCVEPATPRAADLAVKLVAEPARIWLWLAHGERAATRAEALRRAIVRLPAEEEALRRALELQRTLGATAGSPLAELMPAAVRLSARITALLAAGVAEEGGSEVRLAGSAAGGALPLADWRAIACPEPPDASFVLLGGDPGDPARLAAAAAAHPSGPYPALLVDGLMVMPAVDLRRSRLRALKCPVTDPVPFALAGGAAVASFPDARGWSARDTALRAVAEHRASLREPAPPGDELGLLLAAARAALFHRSIAEGDPELCLTAAEITRRLAADVADEAAERHRDHVLRGTPPPPATVAALRKLVLGLDAYQAGDPLHD